MLITLSQNSNILRLFCCSIYCHNPNHNTTQPEHWTRKLLCKPHPSHPPTHRNSTVASGASEYHLLTTTRYSVIKSYKQGHNNADMQKVCWLLRPDLRIINLDTITKHILDYSSKIGKLLFISSY